MSKLQKKRVHKNFNVNNLVEEKMQFVTNMTAYILIKVITKLPKTINFGKALPLLNWLLLC